MTPSSTPATDRDRSAAFQAWSTALVYGLGVSGRAAVRLLARRGIRSEGVDRDEPGNLAQELPELAVFHREDRLGTVPPEVDALVLSPGVPPGRPLVVDARRRGIPVLAEVELAYRYLRELVPGGLPVPLVAVTGSNGKSTTTALTGALLAAAGRPVQVCGNIGTAFSQAVLDTEAESEPGRQPADWVFVVELSSFQIEGLDRFHPRAAAYLNLAPDHMDRYGSVDAYAAAKERLLAHLEPNDTAVLNFDDERSRRASTRARKRFFSRLAEPGSGFDDGCCLDGDRVVEIDPEGRRTFLFDRRHLPLAGEHNLENAMAATLLARALGVTPEAIQRGLASFTGLPHRMEKVGELAVGDRAGGPAVTFWNDSKGTNPAATIRSLEGFSDGIVHLILGGRSKGTDFSPLVPWIRSKARRVYLIGEAAREIEAAIGSTSGSGPPPVPLSRVPLSHCNTLENAVTEATRRARPGDAVLLSPACASFDQFRDFAHRGEELRRLVLRLLEDSPRPASAEEARDGD